MFSKKYRLSYLPLFYEDLDEKNNLYCGETEESESSK